MRVFLIATFIFLSACGETYLQRKIPAKLLTCEGVEIPEGRLTDRQISLLLFEYDTNLRICVANSDSIEQLVNNDSTTIGDIVRTLQP